MFLRSATEDRAYHLGPYPLEILPVDEAVLKTEAARPAIAPNADTRTPAGPFGAATRKYRELFGALRDGKQAPKVADPLPDDLDRRAEDVKGYCYFMNAAQVGICDIPENAWVEGAEPRPHSQAVVLLIQRGRMPEPDNRAHAWAEPAIGEAADMRAAEIAVCLAGHIGQLGFSTRSHFAGHTDLDLERLAVMAGLAVREGDVLKNSFIASGDFALAAVSTDYRLPNDRPLAASALNKGKGFAYWRGINGAHSGRERNRQAKRATHLGIYPMEQVKRVDEPTTKIFDDEVPRVPKRAAFFERALRGDLGDKSQRERHRFAFKQPHTSGMMTAMRHILFRDSDRYGS